MKMKLIVASICFNEAQRLGEVLNRIPKKINGVDEIEVVVIDDGSTDDTAKIALQKGVKVVSNGRRKRLPYSFPLAIDYFLEHGADVAVNIDGDMQFDPQEIPLLLEPILKREADFVAADRFTDPLTGKKRKGKDMPLGKYLGNRLGSWILGVLTGHKFADVTCGFRAYNRKALLNINLNGKYTYTQETFQALAMKKLNIKNVPVSIKYFKDRKSRVIENGIFSYMLKSAAGILLAFRDFAPMKFFGMLGLCLILPGIIMMSAVGFHYLRSGSFSPYISVGLVGIYLFTIGILSWIVGLLADMLNRVTNNQEKILYYSKKTYYERDRKEK
ncbi:glycosyltransferase family 2 protein [Candidatus Dojkabacteria bacterium]|jgi:glycosyltransferase involved in cell wall biosynthesis|nr:glycosyltransferase family 2 protein [Candidatus Dojkabacteria bacterium]